MSQDQASTADAAAQNRARIAEMVARAWTAQSVAATWGQERLDEVVFAVGWSVYKDENIRILARAAVEETGMGVYEDKITKHRNKVMGVLKDIRGARSVGLMEVDEGKGIRKYAKPVGVVGALAPVTNPTATPASNGLSILKGANAVIFAPHPKAKGATKLACDFMRAALKAAGAPEDLVQCVENPSVDLTAELMRQVDLVVATGGGAMVKAAYSSGTPAFGVGPGNATSCSSENSIIAHESIYAPFIAAMKDKGGYLCSAAEKARLRAWLWIKGKGGAEGLNPDIIAHDARTIAAGAGFETPEGTRFLMVEGESDIEADKFFHEKLSPVLTLLPCGDFEEGRSFVVRITDACGTGHSSGIFTFDEARIRRMGETMKSSRIMVRQPMVAGNGGAFFNGMPSTVTLGCGTWGGNITTENIHWRHFINVTWLAMPLEPQRPSDEEIFAGVWAKFGR